MNTVGAETSTASAISLILTRQPTPELPESYAAERRPIAWLRHEQIFARADYKARVETGESAVPVIDDDAMELGQLYRSTAVLGADADLPRAQRPDQWTGQPGTRAPHLRVRVGDGELCRGAFAQRPDACGDLTECVRLALLVGGPSPGQSPASSSVALCPAPAVRSRKSAITSSSASVYVAQSSSIASFMPA